jgi:putative iron-regulated protein
MATALGVENVYLGRYGSLTGPSIYDLVAAKNGELADRLRRQLATIRAAIDAIPPPFDHAVLADPSSEPNIRVREAIDAFTPLLGLLHEVADALGIVNNL